MDTASNIKFNVEGDDKFSQFLEKTQTSLKNLNEKSLKFFNENLKDVTKNLRGKQSAVEKLVGEYSNMTKSSEGLATSTAKLGKSVTFLGAAFGALNNLSIAQGVLKTVGKGFSGILDSIAMTNTGINAMAASGFDGTPLMNSFNEIGEVISGNQEAIDSFTARATGAFNQFEQKLNEVNIIFGLSQERLSEYGQALQDGLEKNLKNSVSSLTALEAAYQAASAGFTDFQENQKVVELAIKTNKAAPGSNLYQVGGAIGKTSGILGTKDIAELELVAAKAVKAEADGMATLAEMTDYLPDMYSSLKNAGVGVKDLVDQTQGLVVAFTKLGAKVPEITTQMEAFSRNTISKTPEAQKALEGLVDAQGKAITLNQQYFKEKGIVQGIQDFAEAVGYNTEKIKAVYNETNSFAFAMKVLAQNGKLAKDSIQGISDVTSDSLTDAFDTATSSSQAKMAQITQSYDEIMISFGRAFQERSKEGVNSIEWYKEVLTTFKEPLINLAKSSVTFFDNLNKVTGVLGSVAKMVAGIAGTILSFRAFNLVLGGITNGFKDLRKESGIIKDLYQSKTGLLSIGKQVLGLDQQHLLNQDRINKAIKNSTSLETALKENIDKTSSSRLSTLAGVRQEIDAIVQRDKAVVASQKNIEKLQEKVNQKKEVSNQGQQGITTTENRISSLNAIQEKARTALTDDKENVARFKRLNELEVKEAAIRQRNLGNLELGSLAQINREKLKLQNSYTTTTLRKVQELENQKTALINKAELTRDDKQKVRDLIREQNALKREDRSKDRTPLTSDARTKLQETQTNVPQKLREEELILDSQREKQAVINNKLAQESTKLDAAKAQQLERTNRLTRTTTELLTLQQDLNQKKNSLDRVNSAVATQQERFYQTQNALRREEANLNKIRNKDSAEYQKQLGVVQGLQTKEVTLQESLNRAKNIQAESQRKYSQSDFETRRKLIQLSREQGLAEGSLIEMRTRSGTVALKNNLANRALVATTEGVSRAIEGAKNPTQSLANAQDVLRNKFIDLRTGIAQGAAEGSKNLTNLSTTAKAKFAEMAIGASLFGEAIKGALISSGIGLVVAAIIGLGAKVFQLASDSKKLDNTYKDFNTTLEVSATKFDRANISFDNGTQGISKFNDKVENSKKLFGELEPSAWQEIGNAIGGAVKFIFDFDKAVVTTLANIATFGQASKVFKFFGDGLKAVWNSFSDADFIKRAAKMTQISDFIQDYELALKGQNKELANGNLLTETSNQKIKAKMVLTGEDLEREKAANKTRIDSFTEMTGIQKKELEELKGKGDKLNDRDKAQISILEAEISRREKVIEVSKKQFDEQLKYYEARNLLLDRENKFSNTQVSLEEIKGLQDQVNKSQTTLNQNITEGLDIYSGSIKDSQIKSKQFLSDLKDGSLSVKATLKGLGGEIYKVGEDGKVLSQLPDTVLKSIETTLKGKEIDGKKYSLKQVLNLKETRDALTKAGIEIPEDLSVLADKMKASYKASEGELQLINLKELEKDLATFSTLSDKYQDKKRQFLSTTKDDIGATTFSTSIKKSLRLAETDLQGFLNALDASSKGANKFITASTDKFTKQALEGTLDLTEGLKELGKVESEIEPKQLEKLKNSITGKNRDEILAALKEIGVVTEKTLTADSIDFNKFEENIGTFIESLNAVAESGEQSSEDIAKKFESFYNQMKGKVTPAAYKTLTETLIGYEKAASEQRISNLTLETNALEQQKKYGLILESDYIKEINALNIQTTEENIKNKQIELKRLLTLYKESAPQVIKAKAELESLELDLKAKKSSNPIEIAQAESKARFDVLKKDLELGNVTKRQYIEEELKDSKTLYQTQLTEKQKTLSELLKDEVKNSKAIKSLRKSMEMDEKDFNLNVLEINRRRIDEQFKIQSNALDKKELKDKEAFLDGSTKNELENSRKLENEKLNLNTKTLEARLALEKKGSEKFIEIEKQLLQSQLTLKETQVKQTKDKINESIEAKKVELGTIAALEERNNIKGTDSKSLENTRKLREKEVQLTIDSINAQLKLYQKGSRERLALEQQLAQEITKLEKTQFDNRKERLEIVLEDKRRQLETKQLALEKASITGSTNEDLEADRQIKEKDIKTTIDSLTQKANLYQKGKRERIAIEQEIAKETLKLDKQIYENQKSRLQAQLDERKRAFKESQQQLEKLIILGTSVEDSKKLRASKEAEIKINVEGIQKEITITKQGSIQRKNLEIALRDEQIKLDKQRLDNKRELIEEEVTLEKTKIAKIQALLERSTTEGTFEADLDKLRVLKEKETQINVDSITKQLATYKGNAKERLALEANLNQEITKLQKIQFSNRKEKLEAELEESKVRLDMQLSKQESSLNNGGTESELKQIEIVKIKETELTVDSIKKQISLYKEGSKERLALEVNLQKELNNLSRQRLEKEKNNIQIALDFKKITEEISNIDLEKSLLVGDTTREEFEDKLTISSQKINLLQQEAFTKQLRLYQKGSKEYLEILKNLSQLQVDYQKSVVDKAIRDIDRLTKTQNNTIEAQKQNITKQLDSSDALTKELQEQIKLEDSRNSVVKATSDYQIGLLEIAKRNTGDVEKRAKLDFQIAETKQKSLLESQQIEINSIKNNEIINRTALEREKIQVSLNKLELDRNKLQTQAELRKAKLNNLDKASIAALQLQLNSINEQYNVLGKSENLISTQIASQAEISQNQLKVVKQQQDLAQKNSALDVEQAKQGVIIAGYEKQLSQLKMKGTLIEANANKEKIIGDLLTKAYDTQIALLNSRKELMDSTLSSIDSLYGIEQSMAKSDLTKDRLAKEQAKDKLTYLEFQQKVENESFNLEKAKNKIVRERQKVELTIAEINAKQALAMSKVEEARTNARRGATEEEKLAARLAVESAEQGILAAKANRDINLELIKIEEQSEKNKELINARNQRNQKLQAEQSLASLTSNTTDDREIAEKARRFRELDEKSISQNLLSSNARLDSIIKEFTTELRKEEPKATNSIKPINFAEIKSKNNVSNTKDLLQAVNNYQVSANKTNIEKKKEEDIRHKETLRDSNKLQGTMEDLVSAITEHLEKGGNTTLNAPITVQGGDKNVALDINQKLYDLYSKVERRQTSSNRGWSMQ